jgi:hypothetical protein
VEHGKGKGKGIGKERDWERKGKGREGKGTEGKNGYGYDKGMININLVLSRQYLITILDNYNQILTKLDYNVLRSDNSVINKSNH